MNCYHLVLPLRFIPARAGIGTRDGERAIMNMVHPRSCGDRSVTLQTDYMGSGSSPLVRGSATEHIELRQNRRFIPARAGIGQARLFMTSESSRFIPARAGIGALADDMVAEFPVHPRSCGDRQCIRGRAPAIAGSSPLVRGSGVQRAPLAVRIRFIPARAGIGQRWPERPTRATVHPRSCGDRH
ncbi:hypothetical protein KO116_04129 [Halomonas sp. KO116]|nr:hypothetical protein KO116_04129 [Halomonas sp. KO116]